MAHEPLATNAGMESEEEFAEVFRAYQPRIYRFLFWRTHDGAAADDLTSGVFERAWRARGSFHGGSVQAWLYRIARNLLTDHWRRGREVPLGEADELVVDESVSTAERLDAAQAEAELRAALGRLPADLRQLVELRFVQGLSAREVGERLGTSEGNVRIKQYRALQQMRKWLS